jgi:hypothetical protein
MEPRVFRATQLSEQATISKELYMRFNSLASAAAIAVAVAGLAGFSGVANAESDFSTTGTATARLDFRIVIPSVLYLQVGTGTFLQDVTTVDEILFEPTATQIANLTSVAATSGGDVSPGVVTVRVFGNGGQITLASTASTLASGPDTIDWNQIGVTATGGIAHPAFSPLGVMSTAPTLGPGGRVTNQQGTWQYEFLNSVSQLPGTYTGRVTYTATMP